VDNVQPNLDEESYELCTSLAIAASSRGRRRDRLCFHEWAVVFRAYSERARRWKKCDALSMRSEPQRQRGSKSWPNCVRHNGFGLVNVGGEGDIKGATAEQQRLITLAGVRAVERAAIASGEASTGMRVKPRHARLNHRA
jgi:hypothetical protein